MTPADYLTVLLKLGLLVFMLLSNLSKTVQAANKPPQKKRTDQLLALSIEELMQVEVTSVSSRAQKLSETPSAILVITQDNIRRYGGMLGDNTPFRIYAKAFSRDHSTTLARASAHDE